MYIDIRKIIIICLGIFFLLFSPQSSLQAEDDSLRPAITVINPVRGNGLGHENDDLLASLKAQWQVTKGEGISATWLFQYSAMEIPGMTEYAKQEMEGQEFGLLFEIDRNETEKARVQFRGQSAWYASDGLFLMSYDVQERRKMIDTAFSLFKKIFGYYPKTVGAWWIGGDALSYMQKKYKITAALRAADQFNLDFYSIWGTPWNIPYLPSRENEGIPARSYEESAKVVVLQWAIRDPLEGYRDPLFSLQDYMMKGYTPMYVNYLASIYLQKSLGNMVMGLENGGTVETFGQSYKTMLTKAKEIQKTGDVDILQAQSYAERYLSHKKVFATNNHYLSSDYDSKNQSFWYLSENYRALLQKTGDEISLVDLRDYSNKIPEDFAVLPNSQAHLFINMPSVIDSMRFNDQKMHIFSASGPLTEKESGRTVSLYAGEKKIADFNPEKMTLYTKNGAEQSYSFEPRKQKIESLHIIIILYLVYFGVIYLYKKNIRKSVKEWIILLVPLVLMLPYLQSGSTFLFERKEITAFSILFVFRFIPIPLLLSVIKIFPFVCLFIFHILYVQYPRRHIFRIIFWTWYFISIFLYCHLPYFPLDKSTYVPIAGYLTGMTCVFLIISFVFAHRQRSLQKFFIYCFYSVIILACLTVTVVFSRSKLALAQYEIEALEVVKKEQRDVIYVEEVDYSIYPIYKAIKPLLYKSIWLVELFTGKNWEVVQRPENNMLQLSDYDNKLIFIPKYLGTDLSDHEMSLLNLNKIFDNAQIALYKRRVR